MSDFNDLYCRWAEHRYFLSDVTYVRFEPKYVRGCTTCGDDNFLEVSVWVGGKFHRDYRENFAAELINSILAFNK